MTCNYSKRQLENGPVSISCTVITFLTAELLPKLEVLAFKCCRLYLEPQVVETRPMYLYQGKRHFKMRFPA